MKSSYIIAGIVSLAIIGWIGSGQFGDKPEPTPESAAATAAEAQIPSVRVLASQAAPKSRALRIFGRTEPSRTVELKAETTGRIVAIEAEKGRVVKAGTVIARIAANDRLSRLKEAEAVLRQRKIEYEAAKELMARNFRSKVNFSEAQSNLETAKSSLEKIKLDLRHTEIRAPFDGVLDARTVEVGDFVTAGSPVATVVDMSPLKIVGDVTERDIGALRLGMEAVATLVSGRRLNGTLTFIAARGNPATRTFGFELQVANTDLSTQAGLTAEIGLTLEAIAAHRISPAVLTLSDQGVVGVKAVDSRDIVRFYPINIVAEDQTAMWVSGLPEKLHIISVGQEFVKTGQKVKAVPSGAINTAEGRDDRT